MYIPYIFQIFYHKKSSKFWQQIEFMIRHCIFSYKFYPNPEMFAPSRVVWMVTFFKSARYRFKKIPHTGDYLTSQSVWIAAPVPIIQFIQYIMYFLCVCFGPKKLIINTLLFCNSELGPMALLTFFIPLIPSNTTQMEESNSKCDLPWRHFTTIWSTRRIIHWFLRPA